MARNMDITDHDFGPGAQTSEVTPETASSDKLAEIKQRYRDDPNMYWVSEVDWLLGEVERLRAALDVEHEIQRVLLERLGIEWTPGEPFVALVEAEIERLTIDNRRLTEMWDADRETLTVEIERLRIELHRVAESRRGQRERAECAEAENGRLRAALEQIVEGAHGVYLATGIGTRLPHKTIESIARKALDRPKNG